MSHEQQDDRLCHQQSFECLFKRLRHLRCRQPVSPDVVDLRSPGHENLVQLLQQPLDAACLQDSKYAEATKWLTHPSTWRPVTLKSLGNGILVVPSVLTQVACSSWFHRLLHEYPSRKGLKGNIDLTRLPQDMRLSGLRWLTFGYHYMWTEKVYDFKQPDAVPEDLLLLFDALARVLRLPFKAEAGIINYYTCKSRLSPHADVSEPNQEAPLLSLSLGGSAIVMVGGRRKEDTPVVPLLLSDGDLLVMRGGSSGQSEEGVGCRLSYHAVPKIYCPKFEEECSGIVRININARQVF